MKQCTYYQSAWITLDMDNTSEHGSQCLAPNFWSLFFGLSEIFGSYILFLRMQRRSDLAFCYYARIRAL
jgi:hypothetical protein